MRITCCPQSGMRLLVHLTSLGTSFLRIVVYCVCVGVEKATATSATLSTVVSPQKHLSSLLTLVRRHHENIFVLYILVDWGVCIWEACLDELW